ncbi:MAG: hypothetical protein IK093_18685, partial [Ruminiclostridium sp.]|nr:hypothetical protein [Ruminiclostridium sp.]
VSVSSAVQTSYTADARIIGSGVKLYGYTASESDIRDFVNKVNAAALGKIILPADASTDQYHYTINGTSDIGGFVVSCVKGKFYDYFVINNNAYPMNSALDKACKKIIGTETKSDEIPDRMLKYTVECSEPKTEEEYFNAASTLVGAWLDTLKYETGEYKLGSYSFNGETLPTERDILRGEGLISGGREFCCTIGFDVKGISKDSVFAEPKGSGYNTFYNYYSGALVVVRCRWENGVCRIVDYGSGGNYLINGLTGIRASDTSYDTLFDFYRDTKQVEKLLSKANLRTLSSQTSAAVSPIFMADGRTGYVAIYPRSYVTTDKSGIKTAEYDNGFFDETYTATYSSPIDYKDGEGAQKENYHERFSLVFDDYNCDGNADYAIKQSASDETADGAMYEVRCMSNDLTPRSDRFSFFMAGRHEESIRLQHTDNGRYVYWSKDEDGKLKPNVTVDDYRMYSERYYLPAEQRIYDNEKTVYCFFWNNTGKSVNVGGKYHIEYNKNGKWVSVTDDKTLPYKTAKPYYDTELSFDISGIKQRTAGEYRIAMKVGGKTVYGGFYIGSRTASISVTADEKTVPKGTGYVSFAVKNTGTEPVRITSACISKDGKKIADISVDESLLLSGGGKRIVAELDRTLDAGKYTVKVSYGKKTASRSFTIKKVSNSALTFFGGRCTVRNADGKLTVRVRNSKYTKESVKLNYSDIGSPEVFVNGIWTRTGLSFLPENAGYVLDGTVTIGYGKSASLTFADPYDIIMSDPETVGRIKDLYDSFMEEMKEQKESEEYRKFKDLTLEEYIGLLVYGETEKTEPSKNSLYRLRLGGEYVYFVK